MTPASRAAAPRSHWQRGRIGGLDGLRAIAVVLVLAYHLLPGALPGGMVGVDVFFAISGFLITSLLLVERRRTGTVDLRRFWARRLRRILPALVVALATTVALAVLVGGDALLGVRRQVAGALLLVYNWAEIGSGSSYFDQTQPLLLTNVWSLAVEEQFYLLWPVIVLLALGPATAERRRYAALGALGLAGLSALEALGLLDAGISPSRVYMGTDTHAFGLMMGSALALLHGRATEGLTLRPQSPAVRLVRGALGWAGLAGVVLIARFADDGSLAPPGSLAPVPALVAASICAVGILQALTGEVALAPGPARALQRMLRARPLTWVGERSYGLYLWHWPLWVLAFYALPPRTPPLIVAIIVMVVTLVATESSYRWIETPVRRQGLMAWLSALAATGHRRVALPVAAASGLVVVMVGIALVTQPASSGAQQVIEAGAAQVTVMPVPVDSAQTGPSSEDPGSAPAGAGADPTEDSAACTGQEVTIIGDSVTLASAGPLSQSLPGAAVDAAVSRSVYVGLPTLQAVDARVGARPCVVMALATNGPIETGQLEEILSYLGPERGLVLVTGHGPARSTWIDQANGSIQAFAQAHPDRVVVADWAGAVSDRSDLLVDDQIHPGPQGAELYAELVAGAVAQLGPSAS